MDIQTHYLLQQVAVNVVIDMKEILEILNQLDVSQKAKVLEYISKLEEDCVLLKEEQKDFLNNLNILYRRNQQLHKRLEKLRDSASGKELAKLMEENERLQTRLQQILENNEHGKKLVELAEENQELRQKLQEAFNTLDEASALLDL